MTEHATPDKNRETDPEQSEPAQDANGAFVEDLGENAHQVVQALLEQQRELIVELRSVYDRLDEVRAVELAPLEAQSSQTSEELTQLSEQVQTHQATLQKLTERLDEYQQTAEKAHGEDSESLAAQLADRDARIAALVARLDSFDDQLSELAEESAQTHQQVTVLAEETGSSLLRNLPSKAKSTFSKVSKRLRR